MKIRWIILSLLVAWSCTAKEIVVITPTKIPLFTLPDGSVLTNAYAWRQDSRGIMIVHDGGNYFLNYNLLPDDWKAVYLPDQTPNKKTKITSSNSSSIEIKNDPYHLKKTFQSIPGLSKKALEWLFQDNPSEEVKKKIFALGIVQNLLTHHVEKAKRIFFYTEENGFSIEGIDTNKLFRICPTCKGKGSISHVCKICKGTGKCIKCNGIGSRKSPLDNSRFQCITCRGTGKCLSCKGTGKIVRSCPQCAGKKKIVDTDYCTVLRNKYVREINALADPNAWTPITSVPLSPIKRTLSRINGLEKGVKTFYTSEKYHGEMDTNLVVLCLMYTLQKKELEKARYFNTMLTTLYPKTTIIDPKKYIYTCTVCKGSGIIKIPCPTCHGSGKCPKCNGKGTRKSVLVYENRKKKKKKKKKKKPDEIFCITCHGSGKCPTCGGKKTVTRRCANCDGKGKIINFLRVNVRLKMELDRLNKFAQQSK